MSDKHKVWGPGDDFCACECCLYWRGRVTEISNAKETRANRSERALAQCIATLRAAEAASKSSMRFTSHSKLEA